MTDQEYDKVFDESQALINSGHEWFLSIRNDSPSVICNCGVIVKWDTIEHGTRAEMQIDFLDAHDKLQQDAHATQGNPG